MEQITTKALATAAAAVFGTAYLDAKYGVSADIRQLRESKAFMKRIGKRIQDLGNETTIYRTLELAKPKADALWFEGRTWSYAELKAEVDRLAEILAQHGVKPGDFVAVFMTNSPEIIFTIYAITKLGAAPAMINASLRKKTLIHCMNVVSAHLVVCTQDLRSHIIDILHEPAMSGVCLCLNLGFFPEGDETPVNEADKDRLIPVRAEDLASVTFNTSRPRPKRTIKDVGVLLYTSGTTGNPKAVSTKNMHMIIVSTPASRDVNNAKRFLNPLRIYSCLPVFHGTCLYTALCYAVGNSGCFCLGRRFSASTFSQSLVESKATRMLYVGELCRYLLKAPPSPYDRAHNCKVAAGNGMQGDVWIKFKNRFGIEEIREFYRSTEGIAKFDNFGPGDIMAGKVGFAGPLARTLENITYIVKYDPNTEEPYRDPKTGFCVEAKMGEPGEAIGRVLNMDTYPEYLNNPKANQEKMIGSVFKKGDLFQRTGDLLIRENDGWVRFGDRTGDTFRWQGENVSAGEVRDHIARLPNVHDVVVYGTKLEAYDGQAGAAGITLFDSSPGAEAAFAETLFSKLRHQGLTAYQIPRLIRFIKVIEINATFKHLKKVMQERSWHPEEQKNGESIWVLNKDHYKKLDTATWAQIQAGHARL